MNKLIINIRKSTLLTLSIFIIYINSTSFSTISNQQRPLQEEPSQYFLNEKLDLFCSTLQKEQLNNVISINYNLIYKKHLTDFSFQEELIEFLYENKISKIESASDIILFSFNSIIVIFPFHYFW
ncbi:MAG: hypothetical protein A2W99_17545 [Bacteroidetes bacterium GWF2_33_16]|nr:MAG: hypothetical protein A2X00_14685 [Bacteroidetes bacterium GWE2_32_14]OFY06841.1 MAG: hypothetical protein A2W99_17545 [Bacteroidetes bacterium GWF2_33_16]